MGMKIVALLTVLVMTWVFWSTVIEEGEVGMGIVLTICVGLIMFVLLGLAVTILRLEKAVNLHGGEFLTKALRRRRDTK